MHWDEPEANILGKWYYGKVINFGVRKLPCGKRSALIHEIKFDNEGETRFLDLLKCPEYKV